MGDYPSQVSLIKQIGALYYCLYIQPLVCTVLTVLLIGQQKAF